METCLAEGVVEEEKFSNTRKRSHQWICREFWNLRGQHNREGGKKKKLTDYTPNRNSQQISSLNARVRHQQAGAEQGGVHCIA